MKNPKKIIVAKIGAAHSISGEVRLNSYCHPQEQVIKYNPLFDSEGREFWIEKVRPQKNILVCKFKEIHDRNQAEELNGIELFTHRSNFPEIQDMEEFYIEDLVDLDVIDLEGNKVGQVIYVHNYGAGDILEIEFLDAQREMISFTKKLFPQINLVDQTITYDAKYNTN
jgi:16S rRNA processing protein RimM